MKKIIIAAFISVIVMAIGMIAGFYYEIKHNPKDLFSQEAVVPSSSGVVKAEAKDQGSTPSGKINIVFLGLDKEKAREKIYGDAFRTDTVMVLAIDFDNKQVDIISIPRDSYVKIYGRNGMDRINTAFYYGGGEKGNGFDTALKTVSSLLGNVPMEYYIGMDMDAVIDLVNAIGGVYYNVEKPVRADSSRHELLVDAGYQKLDGEAFMYYVRDRHMTPGGDIDRVKRQQKIVLALVDQMKSLKQITNIPDIYNSFKDRIFTNLNVKQIAALALFASQIDLSTVKTYTMPGDYLNMYGASYWGIDEEKRVEMVKEIYGVTAPVDMSQDVNVLRSQYEKQTKQSNSGKSNDQSSSQQKSTQQKSSGGELSPQQKPSEEGSPQQNNTSEKEIPSQQGPSEQGPPANPLPAQ